MYLICIVIFTGLLTCTESAAYKYKDRCGTPGKPKDGYYNDTDDNIIKYHCENEMDFRLVGNETRICGSDGTWDHPIPWCEPNLFYKTNGTTFTGEDVHLWERLYKRENGAPELDANVTIKLLNRTAIKELVFTVEKTWKRLIQQLPITVMNKIEGSRVNCTYKTDTVKDAGKSQYLITYECFNTIADVISIDSTIRGRVVHFGIYGNSSVENETCGEPDIPANGNISSRRYQTVHYNCIQGFNLVGNKIITCRGRQWSGNAPICRIIDAKQPESNRKDHSSIPVTTSSEVGSWGLHRMYVIGNVVGFLVLVTVNVLVILVICRKMKQRQERKETIYDDVCTVSFTANSGSGNSLVQMENLDSSSYPAENHVDDPAIHVYESLHSNRY